MYHLRDVRNNMSMDKTSTNGKQHVKTVFVCNINDKIVIQE